MHYLNYEIKDEDEGREVLSILRGDLCLTTRKIRSVKHQERGILLDDVRVTVRQKVKKGQLLQVLLEDRKEESNIAATAMDLSILYEDEDLIILDKASGIVSHPSRGHGRDSLANGLAYYYTQKNSGVTEGIHLIGRLDKDTSGVLGIAKNSVTKERMIRFRQQGKICKEYLALARGILKEKAGTIDLPMEEYRDEEDDFKLKIRASNDAASGMKAVTHYQVMEEYGVYSLVRLWLETGRMHQIRFHMASIGHPLLGDPIYGEKNSLNIRPVIDSHAPMKRTALHAWKLHFYHPYSLKKIHLTAEIPDDMQGYLREDFLKLESDWSDLQIFERY